MNKRWVRIRNKHGVVTEVPEERLEEMVANGASVINTYDVNPSAIVPEETYDGIIGFTEDATFYSGGRYHFWLQMLMLVELGHKVRVYTTNRPDFLLKNFEGLYELPEIISLGDWAKIKTKARLYFGSPFAGTFKALELSNRYGSPAIVQLFDPPSWLEREFPEEMASPRAFRDRIRSGVYHDFTVLALTEGGIPDFSDWYGIPESSLHEARPAINSRIIEMLRPSQKRNDIVVAVSRNHPRKRWEETMTAFKPFSHDHELHIFTDSETGLLDMARQYGVRDGSVALHIQESDFRKFATFLRAKAFISSSHYEGYGMFVPEARACGLPVACYDLPTIKEIYNDRGMFKAPTGNVAHLSHQLKKALEAGPIEPLTDHRFEERAKELGEIVSRVIKERSYFLAKPKEIKRIAWVADFSVDEHSGGAQRTNEIMIERGRELGYEIEEVNSADWRLVDADLYILNNIHYIYWNHTPDLLKIIRGRPFIRYEHDYLWKIPMPFERIQEVYDKSLLNIFLSPSHLAEHQRAGLRLDKVHIQPSPIDTSAFFRGEGDSNRVLYTGELGGHKGILNVFEHARNHPKLRYDLYGWEGAMWNQLKEQMPRNCKNFAPVKYGSMPQLYRGYGKFIHLPIWMEPFGRTVAEAYLSGCELITNKRVGFESFDWDYGNYEEVKAKLEEAPDRFWEKVGQVGNTS